MKKRKQVIVSMIPDNLFYIVDEKQNCVVTISLTFHLAFKKNNKL